MSFPVTDGPFSSISAMRTGRNILGLNFSFITEKRLQFGAVLIVQHLEVRCMTQVLEERIGGAVSGDEFCSLTTFQGLSMYVSTIHRYEDVLVPSMADMGEPPWHVTRIQEVGTPRYLREDKVMIRYIRLRIRLWC